MILDGNALASVSLVEVDAAEFTRRYIKVYRDENDDRYMKVNLASTGSISVRLSRDDAAALAAVLQNESVEAVIDLT